MLNVLKRYAGHHGNMTKDQLQSLAQHLASMKVISDLSNSDLFVGLNHANAGLLFQITKP